MRRSSSYVWGIFLIILGALFLLQNFHYIRIGDLIRNYWPVIIILFGLKMLLDNRKSDASKASAVNTGTPGEIPMGEQTGETVPPAQTYSNVFGDVKLNFAGRNVDTYSASNVFGDMDLDFHGAQFSENARIKVNGVFGSINIRMPAGLDLVVNTNFVAGDSHIFGQKDSGLFKNIAYTSPGGTSGQKKVHINVSIVFGDIHINN